MKSQTVKFLLSLAFFAAALVLLVVYFWLIRPSVGESIGDRTGWIVGIYVPKDSGIGEGFSFFGKRLERTYNDGESGCECSGEGGCPSFVGEDRTFGKPGQPLLGGRTEKTERGEAILIFV